MLEKQDDKITDLTEKVDKLNKRIDDMPNLLREMLNEQLKNNDKRINTFIENESIASEEAITTVKIKKYSNTINNIGMKLK